MSKCTKKIIVNSLTLSRIVGAFFLPIIFANASVLGLAILLIVLFVTDFFDGKLSRKWGVQTVGGSLLDPLGDKILAIACILALVPKNDKMTLLLILECAICLWNIFRTTHGEKVASSFIGKVKTWFLSITLILGAINLFNANILNNITNLFGFNSLYFTISSHLVDALVLITCGSEIVTLVCYIKESWDDRNKKNKDKKNFNNIKDILIRLFDENKYEEDKNRPLKEILMK